MYNLTRRELETAMQVAKGYSNGAIAEAMCIVKKTVEAHIQSAFEKMDIASGPNWSRRVLLAKAYWDMQKQKTS